MPSLSTLDTPKDPKVSQDILQARLDCIRIVMVQTTLPANIGSAARAMMTAGLSDLVLVDPKHPIDETSFAHAKGGAPILQKARIVTHLQAALIDCALVFACSSRVRHMPKPMLDPAQSIAFIDTFLTKHPTSAPKIALIFGREDRGLTNDELMLAQYHLYIHANPDYPVLNIASSIQVIASFFYAYLYQKYPKAGEHTPHQDNTGHTITTHIRQHWDEPAATFADTQKLHQTTMQLLQKIHLLDEKSPAQMPSRLLRLMQRVQLDKKEHALLMSLVYQLTKSIDKNAL